MSTPAESRVVKRAVVREPGYPPGVAAPCFIACPCGAKVPAYTGHDLTCRCGQRYTETGWLLRG